VAMQPAVRAAFWDWLSGVIIGLMPLMAHLALHHFSKPLPEWDDNWTPDVLVISITSSGFSLVNTFSVMRAAEKPHSLQDYATLMMAGTIGCFLLAGALYGTAVSGRSNDWTFTGAVGLLFASAISSLYFELALARKKTEN
jgi:hypothetical protein